MKSGAFRDALGLQKRRAEEVTRKHSFGTCSQDRYHRVGQVPPSLPIPFSHDTGAISPVKVRLGGRNELLEKDNLAAKQSHSKCTYESKW